MEDFLPLNTFSNYDIRNRKTFYARSVKSVYRDSESELAPKIWQLVPENMKSVDSRRAFKSHKTMKA